MGDETWYLHHAGLQAGPLGRSELQEYADQGRLCPDDLVWQPDWEDWQPARLVPNLFPSTTATLERVHEEKERPTLATQEVLVTEVQSVLRPIDRVLSAVHRALPASALDRIDRIATVAGLISYLCAGVFVAVGLLVLGGRNRELGLVLVGLLVPPVALLLGYSADRALAAIRQSLDSCKTALHAKLIFDSVAAIAFGCGLLSLGIGVAYAVSGAGVIPLVMGGGISFVLMYATAAALDLSALNVALRDQVSEDDTTLSAIAIVAKLVLLRIVPIEFAVAAAVAAATAVWLLLVPALRGVAAPEVAGVSGRVLAVAVLPIVAWFGFVLVWSVISVVRPSVGRRESGVITSLE